MKDALILEHKTYISAKRAAEITGYTSDYVGQLCRGGKVISKMVGRGWFILEESLLQHKLINDEVKTNKKTARRRRILKSQNLNTAPSVASQTIDQNESKPQQNYLYFPTVLLLTERAESIELALKANRIVPAVSVPVTSSPVRFVPSHFSIRGVSLALTLEKDKTNFSSPRISRAYHSMTKTLQGNPVENFVAVALVVFAIAGSGLFVESSLVSLARNGAPVSPNSQIASVASVSIDILSSMLRGFENISNKVALYLGIEHEQVATTATPGSAEISSSSVVSDQNISNKDLGFNGIAVAQSTNSPQKDELIKQKIRDSFSDEVSIHPDASGTSGVITPVFKKATGDNFVYVLVPIPETKQ